MAGPLEGFTNTDLIGQGFRTLKSTLQYSAKWGTISTNPMKASQISDYQFSQESFEASIPGSENLIAYWHEVSLPRVDTQMDPASKYDHIKHTSPAIWNARAFGASKNFESHYGGPWYVEVGSERAYDLSGSSQANATSQYIYHDYLPSSVEFYEYKKETLISIRPTRGLNTGGTNVEVVGWDFRYMPEYGIVPHCKFGDKIVRAKFDSNVRLVCTAPPNADVTSVFSFETSMNGVDWTTSGLTFQYYEEPILNDVFPDGGDSRGGTDVYFLGARFTNITDRPLEFNCKFTPTTIKAEPKIMPATYVNSTAISCKSPGGWNKGDKMKL
jgi:IPT/TIG domain